MKYGLQAATTRIIFELMRGRVKEEIHPTATVQFVNGLTKVKIKDDIGDLDEGEVAEKLRDFRSRIVGEAVIASIEVLGELMASKASCLSKDYFSLRMDHDANAEITFDNDAIKRDNVPITRVESTRKTFVSMSDYMEHSFMVAAGEEKVN